MTGGAPPAPLCTTPAAGPVPELARRASASTHGRVRRSAHPARRLVTPLACLLAALPAAAQLPPVLLPQLPQEIGSRTPTQLAAEPWAPPQAQHPPQIDPAATFPFGATKVVVSDADAALPRVFVSGGGGIHVLDGSSAQPEPAPDPLNRLRTGGFVRDMALTERVLYVAAGIGGLQAFERPIAARSFQFTLDEHRQTDAFALDVVTGVGPDATTLAFVGTHEGPGGSQGRLYLVEIAPGAQPVLRSSLALRAPVYTIEATKALEPDRVSVFVGTACGEPGDCASLLRLDLPAAGPYVLAAAPAASWPTSGCALPLFVRDVVVDELQQRAYVAAFRGGIHTLDVRGGLLQSLGPTVINPDGVSGSQLSCVALALARPTPDTTLLLAAEGTEYRGEVQFWGSCSEPLACDGSLGDNSAEGLFLFRIDGAGLPQFAAKLGVGAGKLPKPPVSVAARPAASSAAGAWFDVACDVKGMVVVEALPGAAGQWTLARVGGWGASNCGAPCAADLPGGSCDDLLRLDGHVYASIESGLLTFATEPLTGDVQLDEFVDFDGGAGNAILLSGFPADAQGPGMLFSAVQEGVRFFDLSDPADPQPSADLLATQGRTYGTHATYGLEPQPTRWLYVANLNDSAPSSGPGGLPCAEIAGQGAGHQHGGIRVYRVGTASSPGSTDVTLLGTYAPCDNETAGHGAYLDVLARPTGAGSHAVWVSHADDGAEPHAGLMVLQADYDVASDSVSFRFVRKLPFGAAHPGAPASRLTFDGAHTLYAAYSCHGVARYDVSDPLHPTQDAGGRDVLHFPAPGAPAGQQWSALRVWPAVDGYVYVSLLGDGVGILRSHDLSAGFQLGSPYRTTFDCNAFLPARERDGQPPGSAVLVADGRGGLVTLQFDFTP